MFCIYIPALETLQEMWDPSLLRKYLKPSFLSYTPRWAFPIITHFKACVCLPAGAFVSHEWTLCCIYVMVITTVNRKCLGGKSRLWFVYCVCVCVRVHMLIQPFQCTHAGVHTSVLQLCLHNRACVFRPFVDSGKAAAPQWLRYLLFHNESVPLLRIRLQPTWLSIGNCWD